MFRWSRSEGHALHVFSDEDSCHVRSFEVGGFACHVVGDHAAIDPEVFKDYVLDVSGLIVARDNRGIRMSPVVSNVFEEHAIDTPARRRVVFPVEEDTQVKQLSFPEVFDPNVFEPHIADEVAIPGIEAHTALVIELGLALVKDVEIQEREVLKIFGAIGISVGSDEDGMGHVCPES